MEIYECVRCAMPLVEQTSAHFGEGVVCLDLGACYLRQASIHEFTTEWKPARRTRGLVVVTKRGGVSVPLLKVLNEGVAY